MIMRHEVVGRENETLHYSSSSNQGARVPLIRRSGFKRGGGRGGVSNWTLSVFIYHRDKKLLDVVFILRLKYNDVVNENIFIKRK